MSLSPHSSLIYLRADLTRARLSRGLASAMHDAEGGLKYRESGGRLDCEPGVITRPAMNRRSLKTHLCSGGLNCTPRSDKSAFGPRARGGGDMAVTFHSRLAL